MSTHWQVTMRFKWPEGLEPGGGDWNYAPGEDCEWDFSYHEGPPLLPAVGETVVIDDYSQPDSIRSGESYQTHSRRFLGGRVVRRSDYDFTSTNYAGRLNTDSGVTIDLEDVHEWQP